MRASQAAEPLAVAQLVELAMRPDEGFLRHVLGILLVPEHRIRHPKRQRGRVRQPRLELARHSGLGLCLRLGTHNRLWQPANQVIHSGLLA